MTSSCWKGPSRKWLSATQAVQKLKWKIYEEKADYHINIYQLIQGAELFKNGLYQFFLYKVWLCLQALVNIQKYIQDLFYYSCFYWPHLIASGTFITFLFKIDFLFFFFHSWKCCIFYFKILLLKITVKESQLHYFALNRTLVECRSGFYNEHARK